MIKGPPCRTILEDNKTLLNLDSEEAASSGAKQPGTSEIVSNTVGASGRLPLQCFETATEAPGYFRSVPAGRAASALLQKNPPILSAGFGYSAQKRRMRPAAYLRIAIFGAHGAKHI